MNFLKIKSLSVIAITSILLLQTLSLVAEEKNNCLICHTSDELMKSLFKPPLLKQIEGKGEG
jgi:hypothetical protein